MNPRSLKAPIALAVLFAAGCASGWPKASELGSMEARRGGQERAKAALQAAGAHPADREQAAYLIGQLGDPCAGCVLVLGRVLSDSRAPDPLRAQAAWALGRLGEPSTVDALIESLNAAPGPRAAEYIVDALWSKHDFIFADPEVQADLAEGLNVFAAKLGDRAPASSRALQARVATLAVSVRVLDRALGGWLETENPLNEAALVRAIQTVLHRLDEGRDERHRRPEEAWIELREAINLLQRASIVAGPRVRRRVWVTLGARAEEAPLARATAEAFFGASAPTPGRPTHRPHPGDRFLGAYLAERVLLARPSARAALHDDLLLWESSPEVFRLLADLARSREFDLVRELAP